MSEVVAFDQRRDGPKMRIGILRLTDSAPAVVAHEFGFFAEEGLDVELTVEPSWANVADKLAYGFLDAAIIMPPLAFAITLGLRGVVQPLIIPCNVSLGGNTITVERELASDVRRLAKEKALTTAQALAAALATSTDVPSFGIVHAYSTHTLLLRYWLASAGLVAGRDVRLAVVPPARTTEALAAKQIVGFCAGAPWGEVAERAGTGSTIATSDDIWQNAPEKAFAVRAAWAEEHPAALKGAIRALLRAAQFCDAPENASYTAALLSRRKYVGVDSHALLSSLPGGAIDQLNLSRFWRYGATFPWRSHAAWFLTQMARWALIDETADIASLASRVYRPDIYRATVAPLGLSAPRADEKLDGAHAGEWEIEGSAGRLTMGPDRFCDGAVFKPKLQAALNDL